jgi:hypothetical protein
MTRVREGERRGPLTLGKQSGIGVAFLLDCEALGSRELLRMMRCVGLGLKLRKLVRSLSTVLGLRVGRLVVVGVVEKWFHITLSVSVRGRWVVRVLLTGWKTLTRTDLAEDI